jgi:hypothetical protein
MEGSADAGAMELGDCMAGKKHVYAGSGAAQCSSRLDCSTVGAVAATCPAHGRVASFALDAKLGGDGALFERPAVCGQLAHHAVHLGGVWRDLLSA